MIYSTLVSLALVGATVATGPSASTSRVACTTEYGNTLKKPVPTCSSAKRTVTLLPVVILTTSRATVTQTPKPVTETEISTAFDTITVTDPTSTDTFSTTSTEYETETVVTTFTTEFVEAASTTTTVTETSTIASRAGFRPISDTTASPVAKRDDLAIRGKVQQPKPEPKPKPDPKNGCVGNNQKYPTAVKCTTTYSVRPTKSIVIPWRPTTTTLSPSTITATSITTLTSTATEAPSASTTLSFSTTLTETVTSQAVETTTTTSTTTLTATSTISFYAACATNNILKTAPSGGKIVNAYHTPNLIGNGNQASAYDCCVSCINDATCGGSAWDVRATSCYLLRFDTCPAQQSGKTGYYTWQPAGSSGGSFELQMSNGYCGVFYDGGQGF